MRLFSNRSQMMAECGKYKKVAHKLLGECVTDVPITFWHLWSTTEQTHGNMESICFIQQRSDKVNRDIINIMRLSSHRS